MDIGATLRGAREQAGRSLDQLVAATKISAATLRAIEANQLEHLPRGIFLRGFLRAYAREVGLDPEPIIAALVEQFEPPPARVASGTAAEPVGKDLAADGESVTKVRGGVSRDAPLRGAVIGAALAVALLAYMTQRDAGTTSPAGATHRVPNPSVVAASGLETGTAGQRNAPAASSIGRAQTPGFDVGRGETPRVEIHATGPCWVSATVDGQRVIHRLMQAGEIEQLDISRGADVLIGDPATFTMLIDGEASRPLGRPAVPTTVHIDRDNYKSFSSRGV